MQKYTVKGVNFEVDFEVLKCSASILSGRFGEISVLKSHLFSAILKNTATKEYKEITSLSNFECVSVSDDEENISFVFENPDGLSCLLFRITAYKSEKFLEWTAEVINENDNWSVMSISYPTPLLSADYFDLFIPVNCGRVIKNAGNIGYYRNSDKENFFYMSYFAVYGKTDGVYIGIEDPKPSIRRYSVEAKESKATIGAEFYGIDGTKAANSFSVNGKCKWQYFSGDWYDATEIYKEFVYAKAEWLPTVDSDGRPDTPEKFKEISVWVYDYLPNSEYQRDNRPKTLSPTLVKKSQDHWYKSAIELKKALGLPLAYHVYNWHHIPFNIEYPHFWPPKPEFNEGAKELRKNGIYVFPYINALSWEENDFEGGHEMTFENTGCYEAVTDEEGNNRTTVYPQTTISGNPSRLARICPTSEKWHGIIENLTRKMEKELEIDGIYYDQVSATSGRPCYNEKHSHALGGGSYWTDGFNKMMEKINRKKPKDSFYFSECNAEGYMKSFDGFLTWVWASADEVPAFPSVYAGYIQMLGRMTGGKKSEDKDFFKFQTAKSLLYGQQLGWCNLDILYDNECLDFLKKAANVRYKYTKLYNSGKLLRPPHIKTNLPQIFTTPAIRFEREVEINQVLGGAWRYKNNSKTVLFLINISNSEADFEVTFNYKEYQISLDFNNSDLICNGENCTIKGKLNPAEIKTWEFE